MGANAEDRLLKRRLNELDEAITRIRRELEKIRSQRKISQGRGRKQSSRSEEREQELSDMLVTIELEEKEKALNEPKHDGLTCRKPECGSDNVTRVAAGPYDVIKCEACGARFRVKAKVVDPPKH